MDVKAVQVVGPQMADAVQLLFNLQAFGQDFLAPLKFEENSGPVLVGIGIHLFDVTDRGQHLLRRPGYQALYFLRCGSGIGNLNVDAGEIHVREEGQR